MKWLRHFLIIYWRIDCHLELSSANGTIQSPFFPKNYVNNMNCSRLITVDNSSVISFSFSSFNLQWGDQVFIYDGPSTSSDLILSASGCCSNPPPFISSSNQILVLFITDKWYTAPGFNANYQSVKTFVLQTP